MTKKSFNIPKGSGGIFKKKKYSIDDFIGREKN